MTPRRLKFARVFTLAFALALMSGPAEADVPLIADLDDHLVAITTGFSGADVLLFGSTDGPGDVIVLLKGPPGIVDVRRKERLAGIWMSRKGLLFRNVPSFYALASSRPLAELLPADQRAYYQMGTENLKIDAVSPDDSENGFFRDALVATKIGDGLFASEPARILFIGDRLFRVNLRVPPTVPTGTYLAEVYLVRDGRIIGAQTTPLVISKIGFGADIYEFAHRHATLYGLVAVLVALLAGWVAHLAFRRR
jgi:uncharacterized protein (TIGR02186 family)